MKILYDHQALVNQRYGGISRYFYELATRVQNLDGVQEAQVSAILSQNHYFEAFFKKKATRYLPKTGRIVRMLNETRSKKILKKGEFDLFHPTYYSNYFLSAKPILEKKTKIVLTVHDMIHELFPKYFGAKDKTSEQKKVLVERADHIISISESTKRDMLRIYPDLDSDKITVIYHGTSLLRSAEVQLELPERYVLFVGTRGGYKNYEVMAKAFRLAVKKDPDLRLVCVGEPFSEAERQMHESLGVNGLVFSKKLFDSQLAAAYQNAECFVFPSLYEGFGLPALESMQNDCVTILASASSLPEVGGEAAMYFDPNSETELAECILKAPSQKDKLVQLGKERIKAFSWDKTVLETLECYKGVLEK